MQHIKKQNTTSSSYISFLNACAAHPTPFFVVHSNLSALERILQAQASDKMANSMPTHPPGVAP
jgi:hypothetical protein